jgi:hypothetical protein
MVIHNAILTGSISMQAPPVISGSLTLTGSITSTGPITGSGFFTAGTITAQTLVVQTVTSSVSSITGSTKFGSLTSNTHQFTGSIYHSGSTVAFTGNVGIGITNPSVDLEVLNTIKSRTQVYVGNNSANSKIEFQTGGSTNYAGNIFLNSNADLLNINGGAGANYDSGSGIGFMGSDRYGTKTAGVLTLFAGNAINNTTYGFINFQTANIERMRITHAGYVGIGTTTPNYALTISSSVAGGNRVQITPTTTYAFFQIDHSGGTTYIGTDNSAGGVFGNGAYAMSIYNSYAGNIALYTNGLLRMHVSSSGWVGIGTNTQTNLLQVNGNIKFGSAGILRSIYTQINGNSVTADVFRFLDSVGNLVGGGFIAGTLYIVALDISTGGNQSQYEYRILSSGNGTAQLAFTQVAANTRGTSPVSTISAVNDGGGGAIKIQLTTAGSGVSGANVYCTFVGSL